MIPVFAQSNRRNDNHTQSNIHPTKRAHHVIKSRQDQRERAVAPQQHRTDSTEPDKIRKKRKREVFETPLCLNPKCREQRKGII